MNMTRIDEAIIIIGSVIDRNIDKIELANRGEESQNILSQLRNLVEHTALKVRFGNNDVDINYNDNIIEAMSYLKTRGDLAFLRKFHKLLQKTVSHYTLDEENSERLMLKYYEYLIRTRKYLSATYGINILNKINDFPINLDKTSYEYHQKIAEIIESGSFSESGNTDRYYVHKVKPFFINNQVYYEVTFYNATNFTSKFDRIIAFTPIDIPDGYSLRLTVNNASIALVDAEMPIKIITDYETSIRPCEINNFAKLLGVPLSIQSGNSEYKNLMRLLTEYRVNLIDIVSSSKEYYQSVKNAVTKNALTKKSIFMALDKTRDIVTNDQPGSNLLRYLLLRLNNKIVKDQYSPIPCSLLSDLYVPYGCIPFDSMPFNTSLLKHNPRASEIMDAINPETHRHELLARYIKNNVDQRGILYTPLEDLKRFGDDYQALIDIYNKNLYKKHQNRKLETYKSFVYIKEYESNTYEIITRLKNLAESGLDGYEDLVNSWLQTTSYAIDAFEKKEALKHLFFSSKVALIYGAAGTGKSTMINHIATLFQDKEKLFLANTNPAVNNLTQKVSASNSEFRTIAKHILKDQNSTCDILFIDECSTVSNSDLIKILEKTEFKLLVLVGDVYQIESILYGNWFSIVRSFLPDSSIFELTTPYRAKDSELLLSFWDKARNLSDDILESITRNGYSKSLDESVFTKSDEDEIILCLNYDGLYGINNINRFLQTTNQNKAVEWGLYEYKVGDPVIFNESDRFKPLIYNNLKGEIVNVAISKHKDKIRFDIAINKAVTELDVAFTELEWLGNTEDGRSIIRFIVDKNKSTDDDDDSIMTVVPFQVAYAVSMHKAQGLEYNSVKIIITDEVNESITHNIFYTAITRTTNKLKIYWTPEVEKKVLSSFTKPANGRDATLIAQKYSINS